MITNRQKVKLRLQKQVTGLRELCRILVIIIFFFRINVALLLYLHFKLYWL